MNRDNGPGCNLLTDLSREELALALAEWGEPAYRARQIWASLYTTLVARLADITSLPGALRERLTAGYAFPALEAIDHARSRDGRTWKALLRLCDGETIESVLMRYERRNTVCVSTQVGCAIGCSFCATGQAGYRRNLSSGEIVEQALFFGRALKGEGARLTNLVFMGMGEPFLNYEATWRAVETLNDPDGFGLGARHMTISTAGVVPGIDRLADESLQVGLAVSLHAPDDYLRSTLVPLNRRYPIASVLAACRRYIERTGRRVTFEYALMADVNDRPEQARRLADLLQGLLCHVNLIPVNCTDDPTIRPSSRDKVDAFRAVLESRHVAATVRLARGVEVQAGCGQLRARSAGSSKPLQTT